ncbi:hypothetical protein BB934_45545 (plasmid) [Microvirga ossetica]|uniref:Uncharacterized protein n=1 Tax=Microvirga ossetica TaxID=1882682 RepID=A0A1B2EZX7_9HYPH|nr:hypothetical protein [Microvirga ossetica]ANY85487.1 hypothetical protein BB934_45545 [Microvirga ossetica]
MKEETKQELENQGKGFIAYAWPYLLGATILFYYVFENLTNAFRTVRTHMWDDWYLDVPASVPFSGWWVLACVLPIGFCLNRIIVRWNERMEGKKPYGKEYLYRDPESGRIYLVAPEGIEDVTDQVEVRAA